MRLVVTPLTDRCYRTLMGAFIWIMAEHRLALLAPERQRQSRTWEKLAQSSALYNCSFTRFKAMGKFSKGLLELVPGHALMNSIE